MSQQSHDAAAPGISSADRHLLSRFSYGVTPALAKSADSRGGAAAWFKAQLNPSVIADPHAAPLAGWFPHMWSSAQKLAAVDLAHSYQGWQVMLDLQRYTMLRRMVSSRQVYEVMVEFWSNLLHVPAPNTKGWQWRVDYDTTIRTHALGRFEDLLQAAITHPAMGCYLDNAKSTRLDLNENLGRELLECHTVGVEAGYSEDEVVASAQILTGYHVDMFATWDAAYRADTHWTGPVSVLGFTDANSDPDGRAVTARYLSYLAHHPLTARRIATRLVTRFVSETPSARLVTAVAAAYLAADTDIAATLTALVQHPDFTATSGTKVRTPCEDAIATYRVLGIKAHQPSHPDSFAIACVYQAASIGQLPFDWPRPDGFPDDSNAWTSAGRMLNSFDVHHSTAGGDYPRHDVTYASTASWLPALPATVAEVVDHVSRHVTGHAAAPSMRKAVRTRTGESMTRVIHHASELADWKMQRLLSSVLSSPAHMVR